MSFTPTAATNQQAMTDACNQYDADQTIEQQDEAQLRKDLDMSVSSDDVSYILTILCDCLAVYGDKAAMDTDSQNIAAAGLSYEASISQEVAAGGAGGNEETEDLANNMAYFYDQLNAKDAAGNYIMPIDDADRASMESNLTNISTQINRQANPNAGTSDPDYFKWEVDTDPAYWTNVLGQLTAAPTDGSTINPQFNSIQDSARKLWKVRWEQ